MGYSWMFKSLGEINQIREFIPELREKTSRK
jgi:hypothetical protein